MAAAWALVVLGLSAGLAVFAYQATRSELVSNRRDGARTQAYLDARLVRNVLGSADTDLPTVLTALEGTAGTAVLVRVGDEWFAGSVGLGPERLPPPVVQAVQRGTAADQLVSLDGEPHVAVGVPIPAAAAALYELAPMADVDESLGGLARALTAAAAIATGVGAAAGWYASGRVLRPLREMARAAGDLADGSLATRLDAVGDPDLEPLERSFNRMADAIQDRIEREEQFTAVVTHELRGPLAAMTSAVSIARRHRDDPTALAEAVTYLEERTDAFRQLVLDLLEISRVDAGVAQLQREDVDPRRLVEAALTAVGADRARIDVCPGAPRIVHVDKRRLGRMVMDLAENADRYAGGVSRVELSGSGSVLRIGVEDGGPGVPAHERVQIFERFVRGAASNSGGSGLGLALVSEHAKLHGGSVHVEDAAGGGARFVIEIPVDDR